MKDFKQYLTEAKQEYKFRVKMAMPLEDKTVDMIERVLGKYDVVDITKPKTTHYLLNTSIFLTSNWS